MNQSKVPDSGNRQRNNYRVTEYEESILVNLAVANTPVRPGKRFYFNNPSLKNGRFIKAISVPTFTAPNGAVTMSGDVELYTIYTGFMLTIVDIDGKGLMSNFPVQDLSFANTAGKFRICNMEANLERSFVIYNGAVFTPIKNLALMFIFHTTD